ncbi:unnamed protein product [Ectocarpus fasciculatus]
MSLTGLLSSNTILLLRAVPSRRRRKSISRESGSSTPSAQPRPERAEDAIALRPPVHLLKLELLALKGLQEEADSSRWRAGICRSEFKGRSISFFSLLCPHPLRCRARL